MRHIVILGCGFAGYHGARQIEESIAGRRRVKLTVVSRRQDFVFAPLLSSVASGGLDPKEVTTPIEGLFSPDTEVIINDVQRVDLREKTLHFKESQLSFDYLLIAWGSRRRTDVFDGAAQLPGPDDFDDALALRPRLLTLRAQTPPVRLAVIGGSATGAEWAAELATTPDLTIDLYEADSRLLRDHSPAMSEVATRYLESLGVRVHTDTLVAGASDSEILLADGTAIPVDQAFHCGGRGGLPLLGEDPHLDPQGRISTGNDLRYPDHPGIFVAGDAASAMAGLPDTSNPQLAMQQGAWAARNLLASMTGRTLKPFVYEDRGDFLTLGRRNAALELRGIILEGRPAWLAYKLYYTALMPRPFQRNNTLVEWITKQVGGDDL